MKVNLGSGMYPLEGFVNVDLYADKADVREDVMRVQFEQVDELHAHHLLEHLSHSDANLLLSRAKAWMRVGGILVIEVPDMERIMELGTSLGEWAVYVYGGVAEGERHLWGYTQETLTALVRAAGWTIAGGRRFYSRAPQRANMPCLEVWATV